MSETLNDLKRRRDNAEKVYQELKTRSYLIEGVNKLIELLIRVAEILIAKKIGK